MRVDFFFKKTMSLPLSFFIFYFLGKERSQKLGKKKFFEKVDDKKILSWVTEWLLILV